MGDMNKGDGHAQEPTPTGMIERVADAVISDLTDRRGIRQAFDDIEPDTFQEIRQAIGRAALEVLRYPTQEMCEAAVSATYSPEAPECSPCATDFRIGLEAMIDATLAEADR